MIFLIIVFSWTDKLERAFKTKKPVGVVTLTEFYITDPLIITLEPLNNMPCVEEPPIFASKKVESNVNLLRIALIVS